MYVIEYDGKALLNPKPKKKAALTNQAEARAPAAYVQRISSTSMPGPSTTGKHTSAQIQNSKYFCHFISEVGKYDLMCWKN